MSLFRHIIILGAIAFLLLGCGIAKYPGQPGVVTHDYSKIDLEFLQPEGLYVFEVAYDNREFGAGVGAIVTKLYPGALSFTSNARTNADGSYYRVKGQYDGAEVQLISIPSTGQLMVPPQSNVQLIIEYDKSVSEVDDQNISEQGLFKPTLMPARSLVRAVADRLGWLVRAKLNSRGELSYELASAELGGQKFQPKKPVSLYTNLFQNSIRLQSGNDLLTEVKAFMENSFPTGYHGDVNFNLNDGGKPLTLKLGIQTLRTARAAGYKVIENVTANQVRDTLKQFSSR